MSAQTTKVRVFQPPTPLPEAFAGPSMFLAGSIDMGSAIDWQSHITQSLSHLPITVLNPRRYDDSWNWEQDISNPPFREQVTWELDALERADVIVMNFDPNGKAPISLLELGLFAKSGKMVVCCPPGFWRRGNVQVVCARFGITLVNTMEELIKEVLEAFRGLGLRETAKEVA